MNAPSFANFATRVFGPFAVGDEDVAVFRDGEIGHPVEGVVRRVVAEDVLFAEREQQLALLVELERLHVAAIGHPDRSPSDRRGESAWS